MPLPSPKAALPLLVLLSIALLGGCSAPRGESDTLAVAPGRYAETFDAAREVLRDARFDLDRVDARAGVITTLPKKTVGLLSPWDSEQTGLGQEADDLFNRQRRVVRITFEPAGGEAAPDLLAAEGADLVMRVNVVIEREQQPGWRLESTSLRLNSHATDLALARRGMTPWYTVAVTRDPWYSASVAEQVRARVDSPGGAPGDAGR